MHLRTSLFVVVLVGTLLGWATYTPAAPGSGAEAPPVPALKGWVNDTANVLTAAERQQLTDLLANYHSETHHQLAVLIIPTLSGESLETFSLRVAKTWGLGYKGLDNGILVMLAMKEHKVRIELGTGMERYISDTEAKTIIEESVVPAFSRGDFAGGSQTGLQRLMTEARRYVVPSTDLQSR
jgi:uncharacterized protein